MDQSPNTIPADSTQCWKVTVTNTGAVEPEDVGACDAHEGHQCLVVYPGETFHLYFDWAKPDTTGAWVSCDDSCP